MWSVVRTSFTVGILAAGVSFFSHPALADEALPNLENLNFVNYTGDAPKNTFQNVDPVGWTGGSGLIYIDSSSTSSTDPTSACGPTYLQTYGCPSALAIPGGYNEVEADGNPNFESGFNYEVSGLTAGQSYTLSFYQAASQQTGFVGNTTEQWIVSLGTEGMTDCAGCLGGGMSSYSNADPNASVVATPLMNTPSGGMTDWNYVTVTLTADSSTDLLSFLAWGDNGSTNNLPPMVFLTGVNSPAGLVTPEPTAVLLLSTVLFGFGFTMWRRRKATI